MEERYQRLTGWPLFPPGRDESGEGNRYDASGQYEPPASANSNSMRRRSSPTIDEMHTPRYQNQPMQQQYLPQPDTYPVQEGIPRPLMAVQVEPPERLQYEQMNSPVQTIPDNIQAINLLHNLLSHLLTTSPTIGHAYPVASNYPAAYP